MPVLRVGRSGGLEHQHGSAIVDRRIAVKALAPPLGRRAIMLPATRWRGRSYADRRARRGAMPPLGWPPAIDTWKQKRRVGRFESDSTPGSLLRHDCVPRNAIVRSAASGRSLAWRTSSLMPYRSNSAASDVSLERSACASSGQCSRPPRAAGQLSAWLCARRVAALARRRRRHERSSGQPALGERSDRPLRLRRDRERGRSRWTRSCWTPLAVAGPRLPLRVTIASLAGAAVWATTQKSRPRPGRGRWRSVSSDVGSAGHLDRNRCNSPKGSGQPRLAAYSGSGTV